MCATAHVKAGIGRLVYVLSAPMIAEVESGDGPTVGIRVHDVVAASDVEVVVEGPCPELAGEATALFGTC